MPLLPELPVLAGERLLSYLNRVARFHGNASLKKFLDIIELSQQDVLLPRLETIRRVARLTGQEEADLQKMAFIHVHNRMRAIGGHVVNVQFLDGKTHRYCPMCLLDDIRPDSPSRGMPVGRVEWQIQAVRVCNRHGLLLQGEKIVSYSNRFLCSPELIARELDLEAQVASSKRAGPSALQEYILDRISGKSGPSWLDDQPMDDAARACEMLGIIHTGNFHTPLAQITNEQWARAAEIGYGYASLGEHGIREGLQAAYEQFLKLGESGGPGMAFGHLYRWLQNKKNSEQHGPIRDLVREFILNHFPVSEGSDLLGMPVVRQRVHTVNTLSSKTKMHAKTMRHALAMSGLIADEEGSAPLRQVFDAEAGEQLVAKIKASISTTALAGYLNCNRMQAEQLVSAGVIQSLMRRDTVRSRLMTNVAKESADAFLDKLMGKATHVTQLSEGLMDIVSAAESSRWPAMDIVLGILAGDFAKVEVCDQSLKFKGVMVHPDEVRDVLTNKKTFGFLTKPEAAEYLGFGVEVISALDEMRDTDGKPFFSEYRTVNANGVHMKMFDAKEVHAFKAAYISLKEYSKMIGVGVRGASHHLNINGIKPIAPRSVLKRAIYNRQEVMAL